MVPKNNGHKPIIVVNDYPKIDWTGGYTVTDTEGLSIGKSTYNSGADISLKVWRRGPKGQISSQSEELPITRNLDLTLLFIDTLLGLNNNCTFTDGNPCGIASSLNPKDVYRPNEINLICNFYNANKSTFDKRLIEIKDKLNCLFP